MAIALSFLLSLMTILFPFLCEKANGMMSRKALVAGFLLRYNVSIR